MTPTLLRRSARLASLLLATCTLAMAAPSFKTPVSYEDADRRAGDLLARMSRAEKLQLITGYNSFYIKGYPQYGIPALYLSDATGGVNIRRNLSDALEKSTAFPCPLALTATWNPSLAYNYAKSIGEECRAGGIAVLLGPGMNIYRQSQCGRNFEYFGEDPFLASRMVERYVGGVLDTGTIPTLKHFVANNTDFHRRTSNSVIDERTLHEIYLPAFQAGVNAGAMAVMTSYNQLNGEWCGQNNYVITQLLRGEMGYRWMVMTDWWSVWDAKRIMESGQDLEMPGEKNIATDGERLLENGSVSPEHLERMARSILRTTIAMGLLDRPVKDTYFLKKYPEHVQVALETAREGIVLLRNQGILPLPKDGKLLLTGLFTHKFPRGGGSAEVEGFDNLQMAEALKAEFGDRLSVVDTPTDDELRAAPVVLLSTGTSDSEGWDRAFALPEKEEARVRHILSLNPRTVVIVNSGSGIRMTDWNEKAAAILYAWYPGQIGNQALAEILSGKVIPSGKLPMTIEREFSDSPGSGYLPKGQSLYSGWDPDSDMSSPVYSIEYKEGVMVGYRWYESRKVAPLYAFGHGLSYTQFEYKDLRIGSGVIAANERANVEFSVANTGAVDAAETAQVYVTQLKPSVERPVKELKGFSKIQVKAGEKANVRVRLTARDFAFWDVKTHAWKTEPGEYLISVGGASDQIQLQMKVTLLGAE
jgi:beta-glucosidase